MARAWNSRRSVEESVIGVEHAATLTDAQRRGLRQATDMWNGVAVGAVPAGPKLLAIGVELSTHGTPRKTRRGVGHGGLIAFADGWPLVIEAELAKLPKSAQPRCPVRRVKAVGAPLCHNTAGWQTDHPGVGRCRSHGGRWPRSRAEAGWIMGHAFARELNCTPWEGLLRVVRIAAGKVAYTEWVLGQARSDLELEGRKAQEVQESRELTGEDGRVRKEIVGTGIFVHPDTGEPLGADDARARDLSWWVEKNEYWVERLARYSKAAIDAGVAERLVTQVELEAQSIARPLNAALEALGEVEGLTETVREALVARMRKTIREELLAIESERATVTIDGDVAW